MLAEILARAKALPPPSHGYFRALRVERSSEPLAGANGLCGTFHMTNLPTPYREGLPDPDRMRGTVCASPVERFGDWFPDEALAKLPIGGRVVALDIPIKDAHIGYYQLVFNRRYATVVEVLWQ